MMFNSQFECRGLRQLMGTRAKVCQTMKYINWMEVKLAMALLLLVDHPNRQVLIFQLRLYLHRRCNISCHNHVIIFFYINEVFLARLMKYFDKNECRAPMWRPHTLQACNLTTTSLGQQPPQVPTDLLQTTRIDNGVWCPVLYFFVSIKFVVFCWICFYKCLLRIASDPPHCAVWLLLCMFNISIHRWGMIVWTLELLAGVDWLPCHSSYVFY